MFPRPRDANHLGRRSALQLLESPHVGISLGSINSIKRHQYEHQGAYRRCLKSASPQRRAEQKWEWSREVGRNKPRFWRQNSELQPDVVDPKETHHVGTLATVRDTTSNRCEYPLHPPATREGGLHPLFIGFGRPRKVLGIVTARLGRLGQNARPRRMAARVEMKCPI